LFEEEAVKAFVGFGSLLSVLLPLTSFAGGFSGGGGNVIAPVEISSPPSTDWVEQIVLNSKAPLADYLAEKQNAFREGRLDARQIEAFRPVFNSKIGIDRIISKIGVAVEKSRPCFDREHKSFDGSTFGAKANTVCISASSIARRVPINQIDTQSIALLLHEYSEMAELSDAQAVRVQTIAFEELQARKTASAPVDFPSLPPKFPKSPGDQIDEATGASQVIEFLTSSPVIR
jgi:hypothetical protein